MSMAATPQRPLPGMYMATPAASQQQQQPVFARPPPPFRIPSSSGQNAAPSQQSQVAPVRPSSGIANASPAPSLTPLERAAHTINRKLDMEKRYPEIDNYVSQGISSDYDLPTSPAWVPFQKVKTYDIPDQIFEQYNQAQVNTMMGLFASLNHAWITIDNALYLWDYTAPNPELIGFEDQPNTITAVSLLSPRPGVFVNTISHLLVVATTSDVLLIGLSCKKGAGTVQDVSLYQTRMQVSIKGLDVDCITGSAKTGRIFFGGRSSNDVYELTYQQEEKWFANRCGKINHVTKSFSNVFPSLPFTTKAATECIMQMEIDDSRNLLYTLSNRSTIRVFHMKSPNVLDCVITRTLESIKTNIGHMISQSDLLGPKVLLTSISPISSTEASRLNLVAITTTGCRIFLSATSGTYYSSDISAAPTSMQVHHVKFPPSHPFDPRTTSPRGTSTQLTSYQTQTAINTSSVELTETRKSVRYSPGYFFCFVRKQENGTDHLFMSAPDSGRIARPPDGSQGARYSEFGQWLPLGGVTEDIGLTNSSFGAAPNPIGFGNELAVQFDHPVNEFAILTNQGVQTIKRRRLVDMFASTIKYGGGEDGLEGEFKKFVRLYGRSETTATALAVACGQGSDSPGKIGDNEILEKARKAFIELGGKATLNENSVLDQSVPPIDNVRPSPRHEGIALYISRLIRSVWKSSILKEGTTPTAGLEVKSTVPIPKLQAVQQNLQDLQKFLESNKSFIDGMAGPEALGRVATRQEEIALQGEHRALTSLVTLIANVIEGISFVLVLLEERVEDIVLSLSDTSRQQVRQLTYEGLFCTKEGKDMAKELVKAIVNRNIAKGSNVDTVAEALRRRCGSFCSSDDVVIFKAQEQLKKASEAGANSEAGRALLNESLRLFEKVSGSLTMEHLQLAVEQYVALSFFAGAIRLALEVAQQLDRGKRALAWVKDGSPAQDPRKGAFESRAKCYDLIFNIIRAVDQASAQSPEMVDGHLSLVGRRKAEAYDEIDNSSDEVFQTYLYDWYLSQGWSERLLDISSPYVISYLERKSQDDVAHADLLWKYYLKQHRFFEAAQVQLQLAKSGYDLDLEDRIQYISRAQTNASVRSGAYGDMRRSAVQRQELLREASDLLEIANVQDDLLNRMKEDERLKGERREEVLKQLRGQILSLQDMYNGYADQAGYYDLCIVIYHIADYRSAADVESTWENLIIQAHSKAIDAESGSPWEFVATRIEETAKKISYSEITFPVAFILPLLMTYQLQTALPLGAPFNWPYDLLLNCRVSHESMLAVLEQRFLADEAPFTGRNKRIVANAIVYVLERWYHASVGKNGVPFDSEENALAVSEALKMVTSSGRVLDNESREMAAFLSVRVDQALR